MTTSAELSIARRGDWVQIHVVILRPEERAQSLPEATRAVPYEGWIKGLLRDEEAHVGDPVRIRTVIGREVTGTLVSINPRYEHDFGRPQPVLIEIGSEARQRLAEE